MPLWAQFVDVIYGVLVCVSTALGGSMGWAIAIVSLVVRAVLLPVTVRVAYRALETRLALKRLEPQIAKLRRRCGKDQARLLEETAKLYRRHGVKVADGRSLAAMAVQMPLFLGLFGAIRRGLGEGGAFLWVRSIGQPDLPLAALCAVVTAISSALAPEVTTSHRVPMIVLPALATLFFLSRLAAGLSVYALAQGVVGLGQAVLVRRRARQLLAAQP